MNAGRSFSMSEGEAQDEPSPACGAPTPWAGYFAHPPFQKPIFAPFSRGGAQGDESWEAGSVKILKYNTQWDGIL